MSISLDTEVFCIYSAKLKYITRDWEEKRRGDGEIINKNKKITTLIYS